MEIPFDKVYIVSFVKNIDKQNRIKSFLDNLNIQYEFIYGIDTNSLLDIINYQTIEFINKNKHDEFTYNIGHISCGIAHYTAIQHAYESNYNKILIIEDDAIFTSDINYIEYCFNNMPKDADSCRFGLTWRNNDEIIRISNDFWIKNRSYVGTQCYSINNRETMLQFLTEMNLHFRESDDNYLLHDKNVYQLKTLICKDPNSPLEIKK